MKKIGLICATALMGMSLAACNNSASQKPSKSNSSSTVKSTKAVKHHKTHKENKNQKVKKSTSSVINNQQSQSSISSTISSSKKVDTQQSNTTSASNNSDDEKGPSEVIVLGDNGPTAYEYSGHINGNHPEESSSATSVARALNNAGYTGDFSEH